MQTAAEKSNRGVFFIIGLVSVLIVGFLIWLIYFKESSSGVPGTVTYLPAVNAILNSLSATCLILGFRAIKAQRQLHHKRYMLTALVFSILFFVSYVIYHNLHGDTPFTGTGIVRPIYFFILISHVVLSAAMLPMILITLYYAFTGNFAKHPQIARLTYPVWLYVSITGVLIFFLLKYFG